MKTRMVTLQEYLKLNPLVEEEQALRIEYNKVLIEEYPFLSISRLREDVEEDYEWTFMDDMPDGWRIAFGKQMLEELKAELIRWNFLDQYYVLEVKEKYGELRWYDAGIPADEDCKIWDIVDKYEDLSRKVCQYCGKPAQVYTDGWVGYFCKECADERGMVYGTLNSEGVADEIS